jgi:hypothetical protein
MIFLRFLQIILTKFEQRTPPTRQVIIQILGVSRMESKKDYALHTLTYSKTFILLKNAQFISNNMCKCKRLINQKLRKAGKYG